MAVITYAVPNGCASFSVSKLGAASWNKWDGWEAIVQGDLKSLGWTKRHKRSIQKISAPCAPSRRFKRFDMAKKPKIKTISVCVQDEGEPLDSDGTVVKLPEDFIHKDALLPPKFQVRVRGTALCYYRGDPKFPSFVIGTLNMMQLKKVREAVNAEALLTTPRANDAAPPQGGNPEAKC